jgi:hypothetical protein
MTRRKSKSLTTCYVKPISLQNMRLAARGLGLGATLTMAYLNFEEEVKVNSGLPPTGTLCDPPEPSWEAEWLSTVTHSKRKLRF